MKWVWMSFRLLLLLLLCLRRLLQKPMQTGFRHGFQHVSHNCMRTERRQSARHRVHWTESTKRNHLFLYHLYIYFRTEALRMQGLACKDIYFFSQPKKHSNFGVKQNERKSQSLPTAEELQTPISRTLMQALGIRVQEGSPGESPERLGLSAHTWHFSWRTGLETGMGQELQSTGAFGGPILF